MDGWKNLDSRMDGWWINGWIKRWMDDKWMDKKDVWMDGCMDGKWWMVENRWIKRWMDDKWMD